MLFFDRFKTGLQDCIGVFSLKLSDSIPSAKSVLGDLLTSEKPIGKDQYTLAYRRDDVIHNGINTKSQLIITPEINFKCYDDKGERVPEDELFLKSYSETIDLQNILLETTKDALKYGIGWIENLYPDSINREHIVSQRSVAGEPLDFLRDFNNNIVYEDDNITPKSYVQYVSDMADVPTSRDPDSLYGVAPQQKAMVVFREEMIPIKLNRDMISVIEPQYDILRQKISTMRTNDVARRNRAVPRYHISVGDENYRPGPDERKKIKDEIKQTKPNDDIVTDGFVKINELGKNINDEGLEREEMYVLRQCTAMGIPYAYITSSGDKTNKSIVSDQKMLLFQSISTLRKLISKQYMNATIPLLNHKFKSTRQHMIFDELSLDSMESKSLRLQRYAKSELITPDNDLEKFIRENEGLPQMNPNTKVDEEKDDQDRG